MLAERGVRLRANNYFWGVCLATGALALFAVYHSVIADETDPGKSTSQSNSARLEAEIQSLHEELASTKELLREAASGDDELLLAQRGDGPARADDPPPAKSGAKSTDDKQDDKKFDNDAWRALDKELARKWRRGPGGPPGMHPGMDRGFRGGPPPWARARLRRRTPLGTSRPRTRRPPLGTPPPSWLPPLGTAPPARPRGTSPSTRPSSRTRRIRLGNVAAGNIAALAAFGPRSARRRSHDANLPSLG